MSYDLNKKFVVAISSRALFDLNREDAIFRRHGVEMFIAHQKRHSQKKLEPGPAFWLVDALLKLNEFLDDSPIEVVLVSRNSPAAALRVRKSLDGHDIEIKRFWFASGDSVSPYLKAASVDLFLSANQDDVKSAHANGCAAGRVMGTPRKPVATDTNALRIAFDGDAVIFAEESERIYKDQGISEFLKHEETNEDVVIPDGPFANIFRKIGELRAGLPAEHKDKVKIGLFTARNAPADKRVLKTIEEWGVVPDHLAFLGGVSKEKTIQAFSPHIYFDDQATHLIPVSRSHSVAMVPSSLADDLGEIPDCPGCGDKMVKRMARKVPYNGKEFWGCQNFPRCCETISIP